jgi:hypothetical protein
MSKRSCALTAIAGQCGHGHSRFHSSSPPFKAVAAMGRARGAPHIRLQSGQTTCKPSPDIRSDEEDNMEASSGGTAITLTDAPDDDERAVIMDGLRSYNESQAGNSDARLLAILVRNPDTKKVVGGLLGRTSLGLLTVSGFFCRKSCGATGLAARSSRWQKKRHAGAAAPARCCPLFIFRRRASTGSRVGRSLPRLIVSRPAIRGST